MYVVTVFMKLKVKVWKYGRNYLLLIPVGENGNELSKFVDKEVIVKLNSTTIVGIVKPIRYKSSGAKTFGIRIERCKELEKLINKTITIDVSLTDIKFEENKQDLVDVRIYFSRTFYNMLKHVANKLGVNPEDLVNHFIMNCFLPYIDMMYKVIKHG